MGRVWLHARKKPRSRSVERVRLWEVGGVSARIRVTQHVLFRPQPVISTAIRGHSALGGHACTGENDDALSISQETRTSDVTSPPRSQCSSPRSKSSPECLLEPDRGSFALFSRYFVNRP